MLKNKDVVPSKIVGIQFGILSPQEILNQSKDCGVAGIKLVSNDFVKNKGWLNSKNSGKMRLEGKEYIVKDGDVLNFRFNSCPNFFHTEVN